MFFLFFFFPQNTKFDAAEHRLRNPGLDRPNGEGGGGELVFLKNGTIVKKTRIFLL